MRTPWVLLDSILIPEDSIASTRHLARRMMISWMVPTVSKKWSSYEIAIAHNHLIEQIIQVGHISDKDKDLLKALNPEWLYKSSGKLYETWKRMSVPHLSWTSKFNAQLGKSEQILWYTNLRFLWVIWTKNGRKLKKDVFNLRKDSFSFLWTMNVYTIK